MNTLIAFAGHIGSGKDEACNYLEQIFGFKHYKVAHAVHDVVAILGNFYEADLSHRLKFNDREWKEKAVIMFNNDGVPMTPRSLLKYIATELVRDQLNRSAWADIFYEYVELNNQNIAVSDFRYPEEFKPLKELKNTLGYLVYIINPLAAENADTSHSSEQHQHYLKSQADYLVFNDPRVNSLESFKQSVYEITEDILELNQILEDANTKVDL